MGDARFDRVSEPFAEEAAGGFHEASFLREVLMDLTLAVDLGRPVFVLGAKGGGKSSLLRQAARLRRDRYGIAWLQGRPRLALDDVVAACRDGFDPESWKGLAVRRGRAAKEPRRPGDNLLVVEDAEAITPRFIEQLVTLSNGYPDILPSHRLLVAGRSEMAPNIETSPVRNDWGLPLVLRLPPWPDDEILPFLRHRLLRAGRIDPGVFSGPAAARIVAEAAGNPGRALELAQDALRLAGTDGASQIDEDHVEAASRNPRAAPSPDPSLDWQVAGPSFSPSIGRARPTVIDVEAVELSADGTPTIDAPADAPKRRASPPNPSVGAVGRRLPIGARSGAIAASLVALVAAGFLLWGLVGPADAPPPANTLPVASAPPAAPPPPAVPVAVASTAAAPPPSHPETLVAEFAPAPAPPPAPAPAAAPAIPVESLIERGDALLQAGDFASSRLFYLQAVRTGSARAATAVARTYDPLVLDRLGVIGGRGDADKAAEWYRKAVELGDTVAAEPLRRLSAP